MAGMLELLKLDMVEGTFFSSSQIREIYLQLGFEIKPNQSAQEQVHAIESRVNLAMLHRDLMRSPEKLQFPASVLFELRMACRPILLGLGLDEADISSLWMRYVYWLRGIVVCGILEPAESRIEKALESRLPFLVGFRFTEQVWSCWIIDRNTKTFEYYDPQFRKRSDDAVARIYEMAKTHDPEIKVLTAAFPQHGFASKPEDCGFRCLEFLHSRIVERLSFEETLHAKQHSCESLKNKFFQIQDSRFVASCTLAFPEAAYQVAKIPFQQFLEHLYLYADSVTIKARIREFVLRFRDSNSPNAAALQIQQELYGMMPVAVQEYVGQNIWEKILQEICADPLTQHLLTLDAPQREELVAQLAQDAALTELSKEKENVYQVTWRLRQSAREQLLETKNPKQALVSTMFPYESQLVKPLQVANLPELEVGLEKCDRIITQALELVKSAITELVELPPTPKVDMVKLHNICNLHENDILKKQFLRAGLEGWNFPLPDTAILLDSLEPRFRNYACNKLELRELVHLKNFLLFLTIGVWIFALREPRDQPDLAIVKGCLNALIQVTETDEMPHSVLCALLQIVKFQPPDCETAGALAFFRDARAVYAGIV